MSSYHLYKETRDYNASLKAAIDHNKQRAERRAENIAAATDAPLHTLRIDGRSCKLIKSQDHWEAIENGSSLIPWNGREDCMIDRFDGRAMLDMYKEPDPRILALRRKTEAEREAEDLCAFEGYRDLVKLLQMGLTEEEGVVYSDRLNTEIKSRAKQGALELVKAARGDPRGGAGAGPSGARGPPPAGQGDFASVGFDYGGGSEATAAEREAEDIYRAAQADDATVDAEIAVEQDADLVAQRTFGLERFSARLEACELEEAGSEAQRLILQLRQQSKLKRRTALVRKLELEAAHGRPESGSGRDRASDRDRNRRPRRDSPSYDRYRRRSRSRSRSRSRERGRRAARPVAPSQTKEFITSFEVAAEGGFPRVDDYVDDWERPGRGAEAAARARIHDALTHDPAALGGALVIEGEDRRAPPPIRERERERDRDRDRERDRRADAGGAPGPLNLKAAAAAPAGVHVGGQERRETPQERLKRLMAAQLEKKAQKDQLSELRKKESERAARDARDAMERTLMRR